MSIEKTFTVTTPKPVEEVFAYLADLRNMTQWNPVVDEVTPLGTGPVDAVGATFEIVDHRGVFPDGKMRAELTTVEPPHRIVMHSTTSSVEGDDTLTVRALPDGGSEVVYATDIELHGAAKLGGPISSLSVGSLMKKMAAGLEEKLA